MLPDSRICTTKYMDKIPMDKNTQTQIYIRNQLFTPHTTGIKNDHYIMHIEMEQTYNTKKLCSINKFMIERRILILRYTVHNNNNGCIDIENGKNQK